MDRGRTAFVPGRPAETRGEEPEDDNGPREDAVDSAGAVASAEVPDQGEQEAGAAVADSHATREGREGTGQ